MIYILVVTGHASKEVALFAETSVDSGQNSYISRFFARLQIKFLQKLSDLDPFFVLYDHMIELLLVFLVEGQKNGGRFDSATMHDKPVAW